jgi:hypothetical protein
MVGVREEAAKLGSIEMRDFDTGVIGKSEVKRDAQFWFGTINAVLDVMRQQDSKVVAKAKQKEQAASRAASRTASQAGSVRTASQTGSIPPSTASSAIVSFPTSSGSTTISLPASSISIATSRKRTAPEIMLGPLLKKSRQAPSPPASPADPKTPDQPTQPENPDLSLGSNISGNTVELKDEETTKVLMNRFLTDSLFMLGNEFAEINWHRGSHALELMHTYIPFSYLLMLETKIRRNSRWVWNRLSQSMMVGLESSIIIAMFKNGNTTTINDLFSPSRYYPPLISLP